jgi:16S rRNA (guanine527-N7)-methyltransferase
MARRTNFDPKKRASPGNAPRTAIDLTDDRGLAMRLTPVSRETRGRLERYVELLLEWQERTNLVAPSTLTTIWSRHIADSLQLLELAPAARSWVDLGSGAGFPGVAIACALAGSAGAAVHLVESNAKKAAFLREAIRHTGAPATVHPVRIEDFVKNFTAPVDAVTARALAPLDVVFGLAEPLLGRGAIGLFLKGQDVEAELTQASKCWNINTRG